MDTVTVPVKSAWFSKINWTVAISVIANILAFFGIIVPAELQAEALAAINAITGVIIWVQRTFFTKTITAASAKSV